MAFNRAVVVDCRTCVDDGVGTNLASRLDDRARHHLRPFADYRIRSNDCCRMFQCDEFITLALKTLKYLPAGFRAKRRRRRRSQEARLPVCKPSRPHHLL